MEDSKYLSPEDKARMASLTKELDLLKREHKTFAKNKGSLTAEQKESWRLNSKRTNEIHIEIKDLRHKNVLEAARSV
jgi:hypothetical protein